MREIHLTAIFSAAAHAYKPGECNCVLRDFFFLFLVCTCAGSTRLGYYYTQPALLTSLWELCNLSLFLSVSLSGRF